jgi:curved DNA-binding protein CbpA
VPAADAPPAAEVGAEAAPAPAVAESVPVAVAHEEPPVVAPSAKPPALAVAAPAAAAPPEPEGDPFAGFTLDSDPPPPPKAAMAPEDPAPEPTNQAITAPPPPDAAAESEDIFHIPTPAQGIPVLDAASIASDEPPKEEPNGQPPAEVHTRPTVPKMAAVTPEQIAAAMAGATAKSASVAPKVGAGEAAAAMTGATAKSVSVAPKVGAGEAAAAMAATTMKSVPAPKATSPSQLAAAMSATTMKSSVPAAQASAEKSSPTSEQKPRAMDAHRIRPTQPAMTAEPTHATPSGVRMQPASARATPEPAETPPPAPVASPAPPSAPQSPRSARAVAESVVPPSSSSSSSASPSSASPVSNPASGGLAPGSTKSKPHAISVKEESDDDAAPPSSHAPGPSSLRAMQMTADLVARKKEIQDKAAAMDKEDYYALLGVTRETPTAEIQKAFFALAKKWHPDRVPPVLADVKDLCAKVFGKMSEAHQTLMDPAKRAKYDAQKKSGGAASDDSPEAQAQVMAILEAATNFQKAEICLKRNDFKMAEDLCKRAIDVEPKQADYIAMMAWLQAQKPNKQDAGSTQEIVVELTRAIGISQACERAFFYRAMMLKRLGQEAQAVKDFKRAMELNPRNVDAQREVRLYNMRGGDKAKPSGPPPKGKEEGGGIFGKLFKK